LNKAKLLGTTRRRSIVHARCIAIYLARQLSGATLKGIGTFFGGRDHTTILHAYRKIEIEMESDAATRLAVEAITSQLTKGRV
jgi:chromosomal replication initiator protein